MLYFEYSGGKALCADSDVMRIIPHTEYMYHRVVFQSYPLNILTLQ